MSTVEKAFLKSIADKKGDDDAHKDLADDLDLPPVPQKKHDPNQLSSSRRSIANIDQPERFTKAELTARRLIYSTMSDQKTLNHYRNLRTRLLSTTKKENFVTMVTPVVPDKEAMLVSANLAATFALDEAKTSMLIEANIDDPGLNTTFDMSGKQGLIDYLESDELDSGTVLHKSGIARLGVVPSGTVRENAAEYFTSDKMQSLIHELVNRYPDRFPIINAPSILESAEARILAELCDQVILVVPYGGCSEEQILKASVLIGAEKLSGLVLNNF
jgi:Mrp family chromosome partitioning ATPase